MAGLVGARIEHVPGNAAGFAAEPWRIFAIWQGGFARPWGVAAVAIVFASLVRARRTAAGAVAALGLALFAWNVAWQLTNATPATPTPDVVLERLGGGSPSLAPSNGKPLVVNLWVSWCPPCRREMPMMTEMAAAGHDVTFLFVNEGEGRAAIKRYLASERLTLPNVLFEPLNIASTGPYGLFTSERLVSNYLSFRVRRRSRMRLMAR